MVVVGAGGTGTYFLKEVSRFIYALGDHSMIGKMTIIDGDIVERKNLERQCFQEEDIGLFKSSVMADILNCAFSLSWKAKAIFLESKDQLTIEKGDAFRKEEYITFPVIVGCVDNHACRMVLEDYFNSCKSCIYLDAANEYSSGEIVVALKVNGKVLSPLRSKYFPEIMKKQKSRSQMSCTELSAVSPQHICVNMLAGNILLSEFSSICGGKFHGGMVVFDCRNFDMQYIPYIEETSQNIGGDGFGRNKDGRYQKNTKIT